MNDEQKYRLISLKFIETNKGCNSFNLGTGEAFSVLDIIRKFCEVNQIKIDIEKVQRRGGDVAISFASVEKAEKILKWKSQRTLADICISAWKSSKN
jgi:UDP-glucose 4-epimerase